LDYYFGNETIFFFIVWTSLLYLCATSIKAIAISSKRTISDHFVINNVEMQGESAVSAIDFVNIFVLFM
jgi:hypothetical protein